MMENTIPRFWSCDVARCSRPSVIGFGDCEKCFRHFCAVHLTSSLHLCKKEPLSDDDWTSALETELPTLRANVHDECLLTRASRLNCGLRCWFDAGDALGRSMMGGMNVHLRICFADGTTWLARIQRMNYSIFPDHVTNHIITSECATLKWLENLAIPTPRLHGFGLRNDPSNDVGVAYMLIDEAPGRPLNSLDFTPKQEEKVYSSLAEILDRLASHHLDEIGSLTLGSDNEIRVGPTASDRTGTLTTLGPFGDARSFYEAWCEEHLKLIADRQIFIQFPVNAYLVFFFLKEHASDGKLYDTKEDSDSGPFFLKHMDDKGDHILVDEDFNITCIIDWTFARVVPAFEAFGPSLVTADMNDMYSGKPGLSRSDLMLATALEARGSPLARFARSSDKVRRFLFALGMGIDMAWEEALDLFKGIVATFGGLSEEFSWESWREEYMAKLSTEQRLNELIRDLERDEV